MSDENQSQLDQPKVLSNLSPMDCSPEIAELCDALCKAQGEFKAIPKDSEVEVKNKEGRKLYSYKYADLTTIIDCTRPQLSKHGLSFTQDYCKHRVLGVGIVTILFHKSGQWLKTGFVPCPINSNDMKAVAGQFTYGKRISLTAALGVSADEDVDAGSIEANQGNTIQKEPPKKKPENKAPQKPSPKKTAPPQNKAPQKKSEEQPPWANDEPPPPDELDQALGYTEDDQHSTLLKSLKEVVDDKGLSTEDARGIVEMIFGEGQRASRLGTADLLQLITYIRKMPNTR